MGLKLIQICFLSLILISCKDNSTESKEDIPLLSGIVSIEKPSEIEVVTWNVERFPKTDLADEYFTDLIEGLGADIYLLQEISNEPKFKNVISDLLNYDYSLLSNTTGLKLAIVYNTEFVKLKNTNQILEDDDYYFSNRPPLLSKIEWNYESKVFDLTLINLHYKCCGDNLIEIGNDEDEEYRRFKANQLLHTYLIDEHFDENVIVAGDWNDAIEEPNQTNVFQIFIDDSNNFKFVDMDIALGNMNNWSWPGWNSSYPAIHFDHILINQNLFDQHQNNSIVSTIKVEEYFENGSVDYDAKLSDHRPVYFRFRP
jgi:exonuclease III